MVRALNASVFQEPRRGTFLLFGQMASGLLRRISIDIMNLKFKTSVWLAVGCLFQLTSQAQISIAPTNAPKLAQNVALAWDASPDSAVTGYNLYYGTNSGVYSTNKLNVGNVLTATVNITPRGVLYYFVASAYDANGMESPFSNEISNSVPNLIPQSTLSLSPAGPLAYGSTNSLSTIGGSGLGLVTYSVVSGPGYLTADSNNLVVTSATGTIVLKATKAADDVYLSAGITNTISLTPAYQSALVFTPPAIQTYGTTNVLSATGGSGSGAVTFSVVSGPGSISGNNLVITAGSGSVVLQATKAADANYNSNSATATVTAVSASQNALVFTPTATQTYGTTNVLSATGGSGSGAVTFSVVSGLGSISGNNLVITAGSGSVVLQATKAADANYNSISATATVTAVKASQSALAFTPTATQTYGTTNVLSATGGSGSGAVTFSVVSGPGSISGNNLVITAGSGSVVLQATKAADASYSANSATATVTAVKASQTISFAALGTQTTTNVVTLAASATSMLPVTYAVVSGSGTISAGQLTFQKVGTVLVAASQAGNGNYLSATSVTNSVTVISYLQPPGKFKIVSN